MRERKIPIRFVWNGIEGSRCTTTTGPVALQFGGSTATECCGYTRRSGGAEAWEDAMARGPRALQIGQGRAARPAVAPYHRTDRGVLVEMCLFIR